MIEGARILVVLRIVGRDPHLIYLANDVVCEVHIGIENGRLHVDVQDITEVELANLAADHLEELAEVGVNAHADFNVAIDGDRLLENLLRSHHSARTKLLRNLVQVYRLLVHNQNRRPRHCLEHLVEQDDVLEEAVCEDIVFRNICRRKKHNLAMHGWCDMFYVRNGLDASSRLSSKSGHARKQFSMWVCHTTLVVEHSSK